MTNDKQTLAREEPQVLLEGAYNTHTNQLQPQALALSSLTPLTSKPSRVARALITPTILNRAGQRRMLLGGPEQHGGPWATAAAPSAPAGALAAPSAGSLQPAEPRPRHRQKQTVRMTGPRTLQRRRLAYPTALPSLADAEARAAIEAASAAEAAMVAIAAAAARERRLASLRSHDKKKDKL